MNSKFRLIFIFAATILATSVLNARDLTFYVWSDTHIGKYGDYIGSQQNIIDQMNNLPGTSYPKAAGSGAVVQEPAFLINLGDITYYGLQSEWDMYVQITSALRYIKPGGDFKTYEVLGNHDCEEDTAVRIAVALKHGFSYYSFVADGINFFVLDAYKDRCIRRLDEDQLVWLGREIDKLPADAPIILAMHCAPENLPYEDEEQLVDILNGKNVLLILHGHWHRVVHTRWRRYDVLAPAGFSFGSGSCSQCHPIFSVMRITDEEVNAYSWHWHNEEFLFKPSFKKSFVKGRSKKSLRLTQSLEASPPAPESKDKIKAKDEK